MEYKIINDELEESLRKCFNKKFCEKTVSPEKQTRLDLVLSSRRKDDYLCHLPSEIFWKITSQCNLRCKHCFYYNKQARFNSTNDFSTEELLKLAEFFIDELNVICFVITGGEPFLQKDILKILKYLKKRNVFLQIQTNATLIKDDIAVELGKILNPKYDFIQVSLEGATEAMHDKARGKGSFEKTIEGIRRLTNNNLNVSLSYTITSQNVDEIPELYDLCKDLKVKQLSLGRFKICSEEQAYLKPNIDKVFISVANLIDNFRGEKSIKLKMNFLKIYDFLNNEAGKKILDDYLNSNKIIYPQNLMCHHHEKINICADGKMYLCPDVEEDDLCLGDLKEKSFFEIWENRFSNVFYQKRCLEKNVCRKCKYVGLCSSGCPAKAYFKYGSINAPDSDCKYGVKLMEQYKEKSENSIC